MIVGTQLFHQDLSQFGVGVCPNIDNLIVTLVVGDEAHIVVVHHLVNLTVALANQLCLFGRDNHVAQVERQTALECHTVAKVLDIVKELSRNGSSASFVNLTDDVAQRFFGQHLVDETNLNRNELVHNHTAYGCLKNGVFHLTINQVFGFHLDSCVKVDTFLVVGNVHLFG